MASRTATSDPGPRMRLRHIKQLGRLSNAKTEAGDVFGRPPPRHAMAACDCGAGGSAVTLRSLMTAAPAFLPLQAWSPHTGRSIQAMVSAESPEGGGGRDAGGGRARAPRPGAAAGRPGRRAGGARRAGRSSGAQAAPERRRPSPQRRRDGDAEKTPLCAKAHDFCFHEPRRPPHTINRQQVFRPMKAAHAEGRRASGARGRSRAQHVHVEGEAQPRRRPICRCCCWPPSTASARHASAVLTPLPCGVRHASGQVLW